MIRFGLSRQVRRRDVLWVAGVAASALVAACGGAPAAPTAAPAEKAPAPAATIAAPAATAAPKPAQPAAPAKEAGGKVLRAGVKADTSIMDGCCTGSFASRQFTVNVYRSLFRTGDGSEPVQDLADAWEASSDLKSWKFKLKSGVLYHNGKELEAADVKAAIERIKDPKTGSGVASEYRPVQEVIAEDKTTVVIKMSQPFALIREQLVPEWGAIYPRDLVGSHDLKNQPIGSGPFKFAEKVEKTRSVMQRHAQYRVQGLPKLDGITYLVIPDESAKVAALKAGDVDWIDSVPFQHVAELKDNPNFIYLERQSTWIEYVLFRPDRPPFSDQKVRQAMVHATDRQALSQAVTLGLYKLAYSDVPDFTPVPMTWEPLKYNPDRAKQLLAEAGFKDGFETTIEAPSYDPIFVRLATAMADQWAKVGVKARVKPYEGDRNPDWMVVVDGNTQGYDPDTKLFRNYHSTGGFRYKEWTWKDPRVDELLEKGRAILDTKQRSEIYSEVMRLTTNGAARMSIWHRTHNVAMKKSVKNYTIRHDSMPFWDEVSLDG